MAKRRTAAEIIGFHMSSDIRDIQECRYQPTRYASPAVYTIGDFYYCCPSSPTQKMPMGGIWEFVAMYYGRSIFRIHMNLIDR
jgi:hypothetical protein